MIKYNDSISLFFLAFLTLFLELTLIRYLTANVWNLGYFPNFILIAAFIGMGIGFLSHSLWDDSASLSRLMRSTYYLLILIVFLNFADPIMPGFNNWVGEIGDEVFFTNAPKGSQILSIIGLVFWFMIIIFIFSMISQRTAKIFIKFAPLRAYSLDILGSCFGILLFIGLSWFAISAYIWFLILIPLYALSCGPPYISKKNTVFFVILSIIVVSVKVQDTRLLINHSYKGDIDVSWSPYQKVEYVDAIKTIFVNGIGHQELKTSKNIKSSFYQIPYSDVKNRGGRSYKSVLILGSGGGNDVTAALLNNVEEVDAVEIDPVIIAMGQKYHPSLPYNDKRVRIINDDGRAFLTYTNKKYDLIIFALTDSLVKVSPMAQLRLENYLFTFEAIKKAKSLLNENGDLLFYNFYRRPWVTDKIFLMVKKAFGFYPRKLWGEKDFGVFKVGKTNKTLTKKIKNDVDIPVDDWPFIYLKQRSFSYVYLLFMGGAIFLVSLICLFLALYYRKKGHDNKLKDLIFVNLNQKLAFLFMGMAFMLLETKSIIQFSLLFGTTWINNSLVFLGILALVLLANALSVFIKPKLKNFVYILLLVSASLTFIFPLSGLLNIQSMFLRFILSVLLIFLPIFFANLIFSISFKKAQLTDHLFGWNLIGATLGGFIEYLSMLTGYQSLTYLIIILYGLVYASLRKVEY
ncbi:MAG: hypothetical protein ISR65_19600 [Bacteriovoracaceae bacterium]|nr:hypothetical protein [Bacteriovoracaceae bacterium]